jgi:hypothetical protein
MWLRACARDGYGCMRALVMDIWLRACAGERYGCTPVLVRDMDAYLTK